jgi:putative endonuclease
VGRAGEDAAERYLRRKRYRILARNLHLGRIGELDIVALDKGVLVLVEVKSLLTGDEFGGMANVTERKQAKLAALGEAFLQQHPGDYRGVRFDVVEVEFADQRFRRPRILHIEDAFRL